MADNKEYEVRMRNYKNNPFLRNFKEGWYRSPLGTTYIKAILSYEGTSINIHTTGTNYHTSIYPVVWDMVFSEWKFIGNDDNDFNYEEN